MWIALCIGVALFTLDRVLKKRSREGKLHFARCGGHIRLTHLENEGMIFGLCKERQALSSVLPCVSMAAVLACFLPHFSQKDALSKAGIALFTLGGISNLYDRIRRHSVTDYIQFPTLPVKKLKRLVWNVADFMILIGAVLTLIGEMRKK